MHRPLRVLPRLSRWTVCSVRSMCSSKSDAAERAARMGRRKNLDTGAARAQQGFPVFGVAAGVCVAAAAYAVYDISYNQGPLRKLYRGSFLERCINYVLDPVGEIFLPVKDKLLPDWPDDPIYGNVPPGTPAPPLLVLDVEKTILGSEYDARHGWRFVKRPGADKFLESLANYYEVVLFSERDMGFAEPIFIALDPQHRVPTTIIVNNFAILNSL